jgi:myo-inositol catabolism protein IolC
VAIRYNLVRTGTPLQKGFVLRSVSTIVADAASTALKNAINDPEYVEKHKNS